MCRRLDNIFIAALPRETDVVQPVESSHLSAGQKMNRDFEHSTDTVRAGIVFKPLSGWF
jgi:hypothetical protein